MDEELKSRLDQISTRWTLIRRAHGDETDARTAALSSLITRYSGAAYRYLYSTLHDADAADEVFQEFALRFVRGDFRRADPQRGHFRHYLKKVLIHLVFRHRKRAAKKVSPLDDQVVPADEQTDAFAGEDEQFVRCWRDELLHQAWEQLKGLQEETGHPYYSVLRLRVEFPDATSQQIADRLGQEVQRDRDIKSAAVRKMLQRARERFSDFLLDAVEISLETSTEEEIERELIELGLIDYCRAALRRRAEQS